MSDEETIAALRRFVAERDWAQFHTPENLAKSVAIEAGELLECFQWGAPQQDAAIRSELADVLTYAYLMADRLETSPAELVMSKLAETGRKYPVDRARGRSTKYDQLPD